VTDEQLVLLARRGDTSAFDRLVIRHQSAVYRAALAALRVPEDAEDVAQEVGNGRNPTILNVDATPEVAGLPPGKIRVRLSLDYLPRPIADLPRGARTRLQLAVIVEDGKMIIASNTSDPATDRRVRVEVTGTVLK
jgi:hypothetical protein